MNKRTQDKRHIRKLISKALAGDLSQEEKRLLDDWYDEHEKKEAVVFTSLSKKEYKDRLYRKTLSKIKPEKKADESRSRTFIAYIAASILLCIGIGWVLSNHRPADTPTPIQEIQQFQTFENKKGEKRKISLPDGSFIYLNHSSSVRINSNYSQERKVELTGEAYFEVAKNENLPFSIETQHLITTVLGTSFIVSSHEDAAAVISVNSGKVKVSDKKNEGEVLLTQNQQSIYQEGQLMVEEISEPEAVFGWVQGKLVFRQSPLSEIKNLLEDWYGVEVQINGRSKTSCRLTGTYINLSLEDLMEIIQYSINIAYEINGKKLTITSKDC